MATPVLEDIALQIVERLKAGTYVFPLVAIDRPNRLQTNKQMGHLDCLVLQGDPQRNTANDIGGNPPASGFDVQYLVVVQVRPSDQDTNPLDTYINTISADVVKAIAPDTSWHIWNNQAVNSDWELGMLTSDDHSLAAVLVTINVSVRLDWIDPYTAR